MVFHKIAVTFLFLMLGASNFFYAITVLGHYTYITGFWFGCPGGQGGAVGGGEKSVFLNMVM